MPYLSIYPIKSIQVAVGLIVLSNALWIGKAEALDIGFQGELSLEGSDNVDNVNAPNEENGLIQSVVLGVYGEQKGLRVDAAFSGEIDTQRTSDDDDSDITTISRFLGAAEFKITPRSWSWYVGDILGGVRTDNALQTIDDLEIDRRNVFVTGPQFEYEVPGVSRTNSRALYINQTEDNEALENLYSVDFRHERDITVSSYYGLNLGNIFTDVPEDDEDADILNADEDFNRASASLFYNRNFGFSSLYGELGVTRYDIADESLQGLNAELRATRQITPESSVSAYITRDLNDQTLTAVESLLNSGDEAVGVEPDTAGFFNETRIGVEYFFQATNRSVTLQAGVGELDFELLNGIDQTLFTADSEDRDLVFASATWSQGISPKLRSELDVSYESQDYQNIADNSESVLFQAQLIYSLSTSFELELGFTNDTASGLLSRQTQVDNGVIDVTENRVEIAVIWAPPSRASQDLTVELKSLLQ